MEEKEYSGKSSVTYSKQLITDTYFTLYRKKLNYMIIYSIVVGLIGLSLILIDLFFDLFIFLFVGMLFLLIILLSLVTYFKSKRNIRLSIERVYEANKDRLVNVFYYDDKIHIQATWEQGNSEYDINYRDVTKIYFTKKVVFLVYNNQTQMVNIVENTLENIRVDQIIQKIKAYNPQLKIIK